MQSKSPTGITAKARDTLARILDHILQDECSLSAKTRDYRWSVTGPNLYSLHRLFDEQRRQLDFWLDKVIERTKAAGLAAARSAVDVWRDQSAKPVSGSALPPRTMIGDLLAQHEEMARRLRQDVEGLNDPATAELLMRLVEFHETSAWMLRMLHSGPGSDRTA